MENKPTVESVLKAIAYTENGGKPDINNPVKGKTGEMASIFQFTPATWKAVSKQVYGQDVPLTPDTETHAMEQVIAEKLKKYTPEQIASMHNAGAGEPDAYTGKFSDGSPSVGINKEYGVKYDVPAYVKKFDSYLKEFSDPSSQLADQNAKAADQIKNGEMLDKGYQAPAPAGQSSNQGLIATPNKSVQTGQLPQLALANKGLLNK